MPYITVLRGTGCCRELEAVGSSIISGKQTTILWYCIFWGEIDLPPGCQDQIKITKHIHLSVSGLFCGMVLKEFQ